MDKNSAQYKALLLGLLCGLCGLLLSTVNAITAPKIAENAIAAIKSSLEEIYPGGTFNDVTDKYKAEDETGLIYGIYEAEGQGYVFTVNGMGYNSNGFKFMVGFDNDGKISGYKALEQNETNGLGSRCFDTDYTNQILALTSSDPIPLLSGATLTSTAVQKGIDAAKAVFNGMQGIEYDPNAAPAAPSNEPASLMDEDYSSAAVTCEELSNDGSTAVYKCSAKGFEGVNEAEVTVSLSDMSVASINVTAFKDTEGVGDAAVADGELARYAGATLDSIIDSTSGASFTSKALRAMASAALKTAGGIEDSSAAAEIDTSNVTLRVWSNTDQSNLVYKCKAPGKEGVNEATIIVDGTKGAIKSVEVTAFNDTVGTGDAAVTAEALKAYEGMTLDKPADTVAGATITSSSIRAMAAAALKAAAGE